MLGRMTRAMAESTLRAEVRHPRPLSVYDSLSKSVRPFLLRSGREESRRVDWYSCGPTVYDASHMGHARNYVTTDILRRLMRDYFGYDLRYVQNVTDVDDKIIVKARQQLLFDRFRKSYDGDRAAIGKHFAEYARKQLGREGATPDSWLKAPSQPRDVNAFPKDGMHIEALSSAAQALSATSAGDGFLDDVRDVVLPALDDADDPIGNDEIVRATKALTEYWEADFDADMRALNVEAPDKVTRVTAYMDEIVTFIERIVANGFAYEAHGSVYFDVARFVADGHGYAKLKPISMNAATDALLAEAEGSLAASNAGGAAGEGGKKSNRDFALWKASKRGEPFWPSPWGDGRPGWHIECSVMASCEIGAQMDIHSGGEDLTFPHHDNELAQSEAYHGCHEWVRYFFHTGHLHIHGLKMSKSLKNFITIKQALATDGMSARLLRIVFLSGRWRGRVDYNDDLLKGAKSLEAKVQELFVQVGNVAGDATDAELDAALQDARDAIDAALADDFDTPTALARIRELVTEANKRLLENPPGGSLREIARFVTAIFRVMGVPANEDGLGWPQDIDAALMQEAEQLAECRQQLRDRPDAAPELVDKLSRLSLATPQLAAYRDELTAGVASGIGKGELMAKLDSFRDDVLADLGIALDDRKDGFILKAGSRAALLAKKEEKERERREKEAKKEQARLKELAQLEKGRVRAGEMFKGDDRYTQFDERGVPTHVKDEATGEHTELSKSAAKKLAKEYEQQKKLNAKFDQAGLK